MPTYDYLCTACENVWELEQRIVEDAVKKCPKCGQDTAKRQISQGAGFILKGGGWYADGYGSAKPSSSDSKSSDKGSTSGTKAETSEAAKTSESKPATSESSSGSGGGGDTKPAGPSKASAA